MKKAIDAIEARTATNGALTVEKQRLEEENARIQAEIQLLEQELTEKNIGRARSCRSIYSQVVFSLEAYRTRTLIP